MNKTIGILAHVDGGKTTLSEQLLYQSGQVRTLGRVDDASSRLDQDEMERKRGITIFSHSAWFSYEGDRYYLLDTPGHTDFFGQTERCLWALDLAVLMVSIPEGIRGHTLTLWRLLRQQNIPTILFLNKADQPGADPETLLDRLKERLSPDLIVMNGFAGAFSTAQQEELAGLEETLCDAFLAGEEDPDFWTARTGELFSQGSWFPVLIGSALQGKGVQELLALLKLLSTHYSSQGEPKGLVYQIRYDEKKTPMAFCKLTGGVLETRTPLVLTGSGETIKAGQLKIPLGDKLTPTQQVQAGEVFVMLPAPETLCCGAGFGGEPSKQLSQTAPLLTVQAVYPDSYSLPEMAQRFHRLEREEPSLKVQLDRDKLTLRSMGVIQLEILQDLLAREGVEVSFTKPDILYQETLSAPVTGYGHYEPLRHYAEVHLRLEPGERGSGIVFESRVPTDLLEQNWQNLIRTHVLEQVPTGVLTGSPVTDLKVILVAARAHLKHTEGGDFRQATYRAIRQGLMQARQRGEVLLLEPIYRYQLLVPSDTAGRINGQLAALAGQSYPPRFDREWTELSGLAPVEQMLPLLEQLPALTGGRGSAATSFGGYAPCHNTQEVVEKRNYDPIRDIDHPADSIFCSHGAGFTVPWEQVKEYVHLPAE